MLIFSPIEPGQWSKAFAWLPIRISNKQKVWLEFYEKRYVLIEGAWCALCRHSRQVPAVPYDIATAMTTLRMRGYTATPPDQFTETYAVSIKNSKPHPMYEAEVIALAKQLDMH